MGLEFLARVRRSSLWMGAIAALVVATYAGLKPGLATALGIVWSLVNLSLLERLVVAITGRERGTRPVLRKAVFASAGMLALLGAGGMLLVALPATWILAGFLMPFAVLVLKAASTLLLESKAWRWLIASPWRASITVLALIVAAWWTVPALFGGPASAASSAHAPGAAGATHAASSSSSAPAPTTDDAPAAHNGAAAGAHETSAEGAEEEHSQGPEKFPNAITVVSRANPHAGWAHFLHHNEAVIFAWFVGFLLILVSFFATRNPQMIPRPLQNLVEALVEYLDRKSTRLNSSHELKSRMPSSA